MAAVVLKTADAAQQVSSIADAASHIMDVARDEADRCKAAADAGNNEFNIRKNFLVNAGNAIMVATYSQYNIVICTDQGHDDFQNLKGQILPMELLGVEVGKGKVINFEVYVFDTDFNNPQKKLDATAIKKQQDDDTAKKATAAAATAASQAPQNAANASQAPGLLDHLANAASGPTMSMFMGGMGGVPSGQLAH